MITVKYKCEDGINWLIDKYGPAKKGGAKKDTNPEKQKVMQDLLVLYRKYRADAAAAIEGQDFDLLVSVINTYRDEARVVQVAHKMPKSTIYSSILEEIPVLLCESYLQKAIAEKQLPFKFHLGPKKCLIRVCCTPSLKKYEEVKNVDFAFAGYSDELAHWIVLVGFEIKRYCDKTMHSTIVHTSTALATLRPISVYGFLVEDEARGRHVIENTQLVDREFLLTDEYRPGEEKDYDLFPFKAKNLREFSDFLMQQIDIAIDRLEKGMALPKVSTEAVIEATDHEESDSTLF